MRTEMSVTRNTRGGGWGEEDGKDKSSYLFITLPKVPKSTISGEGQGPALITWSKLYPPRQHVTMKKRIIISSGRTGCYVKHRENHENQSAMPANALGGGEMPGPNQDNHI